MPALTIRLKLGFVLFLLSFTLMAMGGSVVWMGSVQSARLDTADEKTATLVNELVPMLVAVRNMQVDVIQVQQFLTDAAATHNPQSFDDAAKYYQDFSTQAELTKAVFVKLDTPAEDDPTSRMLQELEGIGKQFKTFDQEGIVMAHAYIDSGIETGNKLMEKFDPMADTLFHKLDAFVAEARTFITESGKENQSAIKQAHAQSALLNSVTWIWVLVGMAIVLIAFVIVTRGVTTPILRVTKAMERLALRDLAVEIPATNRRDEIGAIARALQIFKDNGLKLHATETAVAEARMIVDLERAASEAARADFLRKQKVVLASVAEGLARLAYGDLTVCLSENFPAEYINLRSDFNASATSLRQALETISDVTNDILTNSDRLAQASQDLSGRTQKQRSSLGEAVPSLAFIINMVTDMAAGANEATRAVTATREMAEASGQIVDQAVGAMGRIKTASNKITNIIGVIDEIAFQTNLLALNAGVEAARAGDAGRGFAVVASEVRALAQRSAEAAKEIKSLISDSSQQVENGVVLVGKTGEALKTIVTKFVEIDGLVCQIAASSEGQAIALDEINTSVNEIDQVVQQNVTMVEDSSIATHALHSQTQELASMVGRFNLGGQTAPAAHTLRRNREAA